MIFSQLYPYFYLIETSKFFNTLRYIDIIHILVCTCLFNNKNTKNSTFFQIFFGILIRAYGGGMMVSFMLAEPVSFLLNPYYIPFVILSYLLIFYSPYNIVYKILTNSFVWTFLIIGQTILVSLILTQNGFHRVYNAIPEAYGSIVILSVVAALGGGMLASAFNLADKEWKFQTPGPFLLRFPHAIIGCTIGVIVYSSIFACTDSASALFSSYCLRGIKSSGFNLDDAKIIIMFIVLFFKALEYAPYWLDKPSLNSTPVKVDSVAEKVELKKSNAISEKKKADKKNK